ncbi:major facilitator family transporter [Gregarina niphandrodes]|uniref:Major facilitator family transporter n=1 Tax=Gregarina niphandrodes TaxID=110365 RepID=A0A023B6H2_GRENI|nr:major facilitator family transporter [Gregarina niphandrodes]EZG66552.1 major facilitator family transporter [Gregarina niphandrodes]|eukprot:XP_011130605.1 major facilitator family transporter [Gregarina niphandrodes]
MSSTGGGSVVRLLEKDSLKPGLKEGGLKSVSGKVKPLGCVARWRMNPYVRLVIYCLACLFTSCLYFGWQAYSAMIIKSGAYAWKCDPGSPTEDPDDPASCLEQSKAVSGLYSLANGSEFVCAAVAGVMLDTFGPQVTASIGETLHLLSILCLIFATEKFRVYTLAMVLAGACVNIICFPALTVMEHWPRRQALAVSIIVGCQSAASVVAPMLNAIWKKHPDWRFRSIWGVWLVVVWLPVSALYICCLPRKRDYGALLATSVILRSDEPAVDFDGNPIKRKFSDELDAPRSEREDLETGFGASTSGERTGGYSTPSNHPRSEHARSELGSGIEMARLRDTSVSTAAAVEEDAAALEEIGKGDRTRGKAQWKLFIRCLQTLDIWIMAAFCGLLMFQFAYYPAVVKDAVSMSVSDFVGWLTPMQGPFSFVIGFCMDYTGTTLVMFVMGVTLIFVNQTCAWASENESLMRFTAVWFIFIQSATYNIKYTFVNEMYDPFNFGKLVGVLGIAGGIGVYCSDPLVKSTEYNTILNALTGVAAFMLVLTGFVFIRQMKGVTHKTVRAVEQKHRQVNNVD